MNKIATPVSDRVRAVISEFRAQNGGRFPKRLVWSVDIKMAAMAEQRAKMRAETEADIRAIPLKQLKEEAEQPGIRFVYHRSVPPGVVYCDDLEGTEP